MPSTFIRRLDPRLSVIASIYFFLFMGMGLVHPYLNLHFARIGLSGSMIGLISAVLPLGAIFGPPIAATIADSRGGTGRVITLLMLTAAFAAGVVARAQTPWVIMSMVFLLGLASRSIPPLADATALEQLAGTKVAYGRLRIGGSIGFMIAASIGGFLANRTGIVPTLWASVFIFAGGALCGRWFPESERPSSSQSLFSGLKGLADAHLGSNFRRFAAILILGQLAEVTQQTFFAVYLDRLGIAATITGLAWAMAIAGEILVLWYVHRFMDRFGVRRTVAIGLAAGALRWGLTSIVTHPVIIILIQLLHGFTFAAVYAGTVQFVYEEVPKGSQKSGQAVITGTRAALAGMIGTALIGYLSDVWSIAALYAVSSVVALIAAILMMTIVHDPDPSQPAPTMVDASST